MSMRSSGHDNLAVWLARADGTFIRSVIMTILLSGR
jgi:hypothetical protein